MELPDDVRKIIEEAAAEAARKIRELQKEKGGVVGGGQEQGERRGSVADLFGVPDADFDKVVSGFKEVFEGESSMKRVAERLGLSDSGDGLLVLRAFLFGRMVERNERC